MIVVVGGDSVEAIKQRFGIDRAQTIEHWSGRRARDLQRSLPKDTEAVVVILDRISHSLARKVRAEAGRRGLPISFMGRKWSSRAGDLVGSSTMRHAAQIRRKERST
jgi:hypothetical protein